MNDQDVIRWLWDHGYFWDPNNDVVMSFDDVANLSVTVSTVALALSSFQIKNFGTVNRYTEELYSEAHRVTGLCGEATRRATAEPRFCPLPDFTPPPSVNLSYADADLQNAVQRMQATGTGSWPPPCQREGIKFSVDERGMPPEVREYWPEVKIAIIRDVGHRGCKLVEVMLGSASHIRVTWEDLDRIGQGVIGLAEFNAEHCNDSVFLKMDPDYHPNVNQIKRLFLHEIGHNLNLPHTPQSEDGIMSPTIGQGYAGFIDSDPSVPRLKRFFPGGPISPPPGPPPTEPTGVALLGTTSVEIDGKIVGEFSFRPKTQL